MTWIIDNLGLIVGLAAVHLQQSVIALVLGVVVSVPLGWIAWRYRLVRGPVIVLTGLLYTIPSLALLILLPALLGYSAISPTNLVVALTIYNIAILVRAVADGLDSVDADVRRAATAMGYGSGRRFWTVDLPLAGPVILAGVRVAAVSTIALATVGILVGVQNLGYLFTNGLDRRLIEEVFAGVLAVIVLALVVDLLLVLIGRLVMPWQRAAAKRRGRVASSALGASAGVDGEVVAEEVAA
ncbi:MULTISPECIES: ABC transporter permease [unclassified Microbacterium]|uniref:ABC transporter permease n=1 Tax=unclassified Microbacterium TaxID=2609290 RepID=UPI001AD5B067|nr:MULTISPECIES: ABC transporter permease subunit [unclassified Microbacterium]MBN9156591.1 ABC transporter permease subunit [Microbacterium sp.]MBS1899964.1 ABC transporter permease subunit [Actinomycetota bacterium]